MLWLQVCVCLCVCVVFFKLYLEVKVGYAGLSPRASFSLLPPIKLFKVFFVCLFFDVHFFKSLLNLLQYCFCFGFLAPRHVKS